MKVLKYTLYAVGGVLVLAVVVAVALAFLVNANRFKGPIEHTVQQATQRRLALEGPLHLTFFPSIGLSTGKATLSERDSTARFASLQSAQISVAVLPLLRGTLLVNAVRLNGLHVDLVRYKNGHSNYQDLLPRPAAAPAAPYARPHAAAHAAPLILDISSISIEHSVVAYRDEQTGRSVKVSDVNLYTGRIAPDVPGKLSLAATLSGDNPVLTLRVKFSSGYRFNPAQRKIALSDLNAKVEGSVAGMSGLTLGAKGNAALDLRKDSYVLSDFMLEGSGTRGGRPFKVNLTAPKLGLEAGRASGAEVTGELQFGTGQRRSDAKLQLTGVSGSPRALKVAKLAVHATLATPALMQKTVTLALTGHGQADLARHEASAQLAGRIDQSNVKGGIALAMAAPPRIHFNVDIDRLNLDRYISNSTSTTASRSRLPATQGHTAAGETYDFSALKALNGGGRLLIGALTVDRVKLSNVKAQLRAAKGRLEVSPYSADLYQGALIGNIGLDAHGDRLTLKNALNHISIGPLLRDLSGRDALEGRGNVALDLTAAGANIAALKKSLAGSARVQLRDGAIKGINLAATLRKAKALLGTQSAQEQPADQRQQTDFSELSASFKIRNGVAHNDDLRVKSPFFRIRGAGDINLAASQLDYLAKATVVATSQGQGGPALAQLAGLTVPVRLIGPFDAPRYRIDLAAMAADLAKSRLKEKLDQRLKSAPGTGGAEQKLKNLLRGIFNR